MLAEIKVAPLLIQVLFGELFHNVFGFNAMATSVNQGKSFFKILLIDRVQVFGL